MQPGRTFGLAARAADLSHPTRNLLFQESSSSWEPGACSAVDALALPVSSPALPWGLYLCLHGLSPLLLKQRLVEVCLGGQSRCLAQGWGSLGCGRRYVPKLPTHRKDMVGEKKTKASLSASHLGMEQRESGTRARKGGTSPVPVPSGCISTASLHLGHSRGLQGGNSNAKVQVWGDTFLQLRNCI